MTGLRVLRGPEFSTYQAEDVGWLLTDVSNHRLERPTADREQRIQAGETHYSESLPIEYVPTVDYEAAYRRALDRESEATATAVERLARGLERADGGQIVLVSLARAGVPVGVLLRRWWRERRGREVPHYAISIIRDRGIDVRALDVLVGRHGAEAIRFIDGWTGKGVIANELRRSVTEYNRVHGTAVPTGLAVLSDPLGVSALAASRADLLVPSACLNATVTGLISRTVRTNELLRGGGFDGAAYYQHLRHEDRTSEFIDRVAGDFGADIELPDWQPARSGSPARTLSTLMRRWGVADERYLKPGLGEATRVLLRRPPAMLIVDPARGRSLLHLRQLARERDVPIIADADSPFAAIGIVARISP